MYSDFTDLDNILRDFGIGGSPDILEYTSQVAEMKEGLQDYQCMHLLYILKLSMYVGGVVCGAAPAVDCT